MRSVIRVLAPNPSRYTLEGTNTWVVGDGPKIVIDPGLGMRHDARFAERFGVSQPSGVLESLRAVRDGAATEAALKRLNEAARTDENLIPLIVDAVRADATEGEVVGALKDVFGEYREAPRF